MQSKLFGVLHADVAVRSYNVMSHNVRIRLDLLVQVRTAYVEDALLAKIGTCFQKNLPNLHYIVFTELNRRFWLSRAKLSKSILKMWRLGESFAKVSHVYSHMCFPAWNCARSVFLLIAMRLISIYRFLFQYEILYYILKL